jgi:2-dehydro-3-deoxygalactonokinase
MTFVAVDWGSTRFRAYRVEDGVVTARVESARGISTSEPRELGATLVAELAPWRPWIEASRVPVRMAGMIGSNRGLVDVGYEMLPRTLAELGAAAAEVEVPTPLATRVAIRRGLALADRDAGAFDVMRGEEVQLLGALRLRRASLYVFPGTHSKWVPIEDVAGGAGVRTFTTMMTGELHGWLVAGSSVCAGVPRGAAWSEPAFLRGVDVATGAGDVVEETFRARARWLLGDLAPASAPSYLSGLLIGHELVTMTRRHRAEGPLVVVGAERLAALYAAAAAHLGVPAAVVSDEDAIVEGFRSTLAIQAT